MEFRCSGLMLLSKIRMDHMLERQTGVSDGIMRVLLKSVMVKKEVRKRVMLILTIKS